MHDLVTATAHRLFSAYTPTLVRALEAGVPDPVWAEIEASGFLDLLAGELGGMTYRARSRAQAARFQQRRLPLRQEPEVALIAGWGCEVEDEIARSFKERFSAGDGTAWPPYFPGDRTAVRLEIIGGRNATASEIARCPLSAIAPLWPVPPTMPLPDLPAAL